ncbi:MAG: hypothetical protein RLZZ488_1605 [Pseudomonadota bacterium]|jgi:hypothetical protein
MAQSVIPKALALSAFGISGYVSTVAAADTLTETMNVLLRAADNNGGTGMSATDCRLLNRLRTDDSDPTLDRFKSVAEKLWSKVCSNTAEDNTAADSSAPQQDVLIWDGQPVCRNTDERVLQCQHNPKTGRGLFVYAGSHALQNSPTLVCAHFTASSRSPFDFLQETDSRCVVTEFDWRYESSRSDVRGLHSWVVSPIGSAALQIPALLKEQCSSVFSDAVYCTPTLIVLHEQDSTRMSICGLKTHDQLFGIGPLLRISSSNSRWVCESKSTLIPDQDSRLSVEERSCIPDHLGRLANDYCRLPYMPIARRPVRTYLP